MGAKKTQKRPVALVTGGASFLGSAISSRLAHGGFDLALHYQNSKLKTRGFAARLARTGVRTFVLKADLRLPAEAAACVRRVLGVFGRLDLLVNNASLFYATPAGRDTIGQWSDIFRVNLFAPYFLARAAFPALKRTRGCIVNLTDIYGENPLLKGHAAYCASKAGLINLTKELALELGPDIRVNAVSPGAVFIPKSFSKKRREKLIERSALKRQGTPDEIADAIYFMALNKFVTGQVLKVDGGRFL